MKCCNDFSAYFVFRNSSLGSWEKFCLLPRYKKVAIVAICLLLVPSTLFIGSVAIPRLFTKLLSTKPQETAEKVNIVKERTLPPKRSTVDGEDQVTPYSTSVDENCQSPESVTPGDVLSPETPMVESNSPVVAHFASGDEQEGQDESSVDEESHLSESFLTSEEGSTLPYPETPTVDGGSPATSYFASEDEQEGQDVSSVDEESQPWENFLTPEKGSAVPEEVPPGSTMRQLVFDEQPEEGSSEGSFLDDAFDKKGNASPTSMKETSLVVGDSPTGPQPTMSPLEPSVLPHTSEGQGEIPDTQMSAQEREILEHAFCKSSELGKSALELYVRGGDLTDVEMERSRSNVREQRAQTCFHQAMKSILGLKLREEDARRYPENGVSFDECCNLADQALHKVLYPETPTPNSRLVRVLAGAASAGVSFSSKTARFAALRKEGNVESRLARWRTIDTGLYAPGARETFARVCDSHTPLVQGEVIGIPEGGQNRIQGHEFGVAHLQGRISSQENRHVQAVVQVGEDPVPFFAVCAGNKGAGASQYVSEHVGEVLQARLRDVDLKEVLDIQLENLLSSVSVQLDEMFLSNVQQTESSTTALTMALIIPRRGERQVWAVNVGDSRTLAVMPRTTHQLTEDALFSAERFDTSSRRDGLDTPNRVMSRQERYARIVGDKGFKKLSSKGKVSRMPLDPNEKTVLVLHSGSLNEVFSANDVGNMVRDVQYTTPQEKAEAIVSRGVMGAFNRNLSALVVEICPRQ